MKRHVEDKMAAWKSREGRKPLVLMGARQVGKTWLMHEFCKKNFRHVHEFNFDEQRGIAQLFAETKTPKELLPKLSALSGSKIDVRNDVLIFDEIQESFDALNSLKYFCEKCPEMAIVAGGSLLGVKIGSAKRSRMEGDGAKPKSYPVGKVDLLDVEPMDFAEFLRAFDGALFEYYETISGQEPLPDIFHRKLLDAYDTYLFTGGMPEVVDSYIRNCDPEEVGRLQRDLIALYEDDIVKYGGEVNAGRVLVVLRSLVPQLSKENEKFIYGALREGARGRDYEEAIEWLVSARMVRRAYNVKEMKFPLSAVEMQNAFKLYHLDVGLLRELAAVPQSELVLNSDFDFKGPLVENYVLQQLQNTGQGEVRYFAERADREIDFVLQVGAELVPIEVKGGKDKKAATFKTYVKTKKPKFAIRFSRMNLRKDGGFVNIPLYLAIKFDKCL